VLDLDLRDDRRSPTGGRSGLRRIVEEMTANQSVIIGRAEIGAWSRV
jgi:hypothetical protein